MKKLLTLLSAATVAIGLYAADTGTSFEGATPGDFDLSTADDIGSGTTYWSKEGEFKALEVKAYGSGEAIPRANEGDYPQQFANTNQNNYLHIETGAFSNSLTRAVGASSVDFDGTTYYFDSLVKFTAFDIDPLTDASVTSELTGAKIAVWVQKENDESDAHLYVCALGANASRVAYDCGVLTDEESWKRLTIKAIGDIYSGDSDSTPGFVVFVDGNIRGSDAAKAQIDVANLDPAYNGFYTQGGLFVSLNQGAGKTELASVSFAGQGDIDDIVFTADRPFDAAKESELVTIKWNANDITSVVINDRTYNSSPALVDYAGSIQVSNIVYAAGKTGSATQTATFSAVGGEYTLTASAVVATFGGVDYADMSQAIAAANGAMTAQTLVLFGAVGEDGIVLDTESDVLVTIDLNGQAIAGGIVSARPIRLVDSSDNGTIGNGTGTIEGFSSFVPGSTLEGGKFKASADESGDYDTVLKPYAAEGYEFVADNGYLVLQEAAPTVIYLAQIGEEKYETFAAALAEAVDGDTITLLDNVTAPKFTVTADTFTTQGLTIDLGGYTYTFNKTSASEDAIYLLKGNKFTIQNGTIATEADSTYRDVIRDYDSDLTLNNVTFDGANFPAKDGSKLACLLCVEGGDVEILGTTSFINVKPAAYAIKMGNHAQSYYEMGTTTVNTTGNIEGNVLIAGGVYNEVAVGSGSTISYYYGKNVHSTWEDGVSSANFEARIGTLPTAAGTQDNVTGQLFKSLKDAVDAADTGDTVTVCKNCSVTNGNTGITFTKGINLVNNYTITIDGANYALRIANGTTTPVTMSGTGSLVWERGSGSPILVGVNEKKTSYGINDFCEGSFVLNGGYLTSSYATAKGGNLVKLEAGTFVLNDGTINGGTRGVKADSEGNNATCVLTINGGTIVNTNSAAVAASTAGSGSSTITINGGTFTGAITGDNMVTIPGRINGALNEAKFNTAPKAAFVASGYATTWVDGWYVVRVPFAPAQQSETYNTQEDAIAAAADVGVVAPAAVATALDASAQKAYVEKFEAKVVETSQGSGTYKVEIGLKAAAETALQEEVNTEVGEIVDAIDKGAVSVGTTPGFYYSIQYGASLEAMSGRTAGKLATGSNTSLDMPAKPGASGFYKVVVDVAPNAAVAPAQD